MHTFSFQGIKYGKEATTMMKQDNFGEDIREDKLLPTRRNRKCEVLLEPDERKRCIANMLNELNLLTAPGLRPIKQVELYKVGADYVKVGS